MFRLVSGDLNLGIIFKSIASVSQAFIHGYHFLVIINTKYSNITKTHETDIVRHAILSNHTCTHRYLSTQYLSTSWQTDQHVVTDSIEVCIVWITLAITLLYAAASDNDKIKI